MAHQWAEDEWSNIEVSVGAWGLSRVGTLGWLGQSWNVIVAPLDVDGDGDVDLAIENLGYDTSQGYVFANDGTGLFAQQPAGDFDGSHSGHACELLASDLDADGDSDLIAGYCLEGTTGRANAVYINDGLGRFTRLSEGDFDDPLEETRALVVFDADGDGDRDVAVGNWLACNGLYLNDGFGRLWRTASGDFGDHIDRTYALAAADFDGDGDLDLAEGNHGLPSALYFNDGSGAFSHVDAGAFTGEARYTRSLAAADYDGDGDTDLAEGSCLRLQQAVFECRRPANRVKSLAILTSQAGRRLTWWLLTSTTTAMWMWPWRTAACRPICISTTVWDVSREARISRQIYSRTRTATLPHSTPTETPPQIWRLVQRFF